MKSKFLTNLSQHLIPNAGTMVIVGFLLFAYSAWAAPGSAPHFQGSTPGVISYQGTLTNNAGQPVNGNTNITFRLYGVPSGGTALWAEAHTGPNAVPVQNGLFHLLLGSLVPIPAGVWSNSALYLGIQVGNEPEMTPREVLGTVPIAMTVPDQAIGSRHARLTTGRAAASQTINLTASPQKIPGTLLSLVPETNQTFLINVVVDFDVADSIAIAELLVDDVPQPALAIFEADGNWGRGTVSQAYLVDLGGNMSHTLELQAKLVDGSTGMVRWQHTTITYLAVAQ